MENQSDSHCHLTRWRSRDCKYFKIKRYLGIHFYFIHSFFLSFVRSFVGKKMDTWIMRRAFRVELKHWLFCRLVFVLKWIFPLLRFVFFYFRLCSRSNDNTYQIVNIQSLFSIDFFPLLWRISIYFSGISCSFFILRSMLTNNVILFNWVLRRKKQTGWF